MLKTEVSIMFIITNFIYIKEDKIMKIKQLQ